MESTRQPARTVPPTAMRLRNASRSERSCDGSDRGCPSIRSRRPSGICWTNEQVRDLCVRVPTPIKHIARLSKAVRTVCLSYKKKSQDFQIVLGDERTKIRSSHLYNSMKANKLQTRFDVLATNWLSSDNNSPSSLN